MTNIQLRIQRKLVDLIRADLSRPHQFAWERIGFLFCESVNGGRLLLGSGYQAVEDESYIPDSRVGARYSGDAIRRARQHSMDTGSGVFHVHVHEGSGLPRFSPTDLDSLREVLPSFQNINPKVSHGALLFSDDACIGIVLSPERAYLKIQRIDQVGFHIHDLRMGGRHAG